MQGQRSPPQVDRVSPPVVQQIVQQKLAAELRSEVDFLMSSYGFSAGRASELVLSNLVSPADADSQSGARSETDAVSQRLDSGDFDVRVSVLSRTYGLVR